MILFCHINYFLNKSDQLCINITQKGNYLYFLVVYSQFVLIDHNFDTNTEGTCLEVGWKKHAEYVFTRFNSHNTGMSHYKLEII